MKLSVISRFCFNLSLLSDSVCLSLEVFIPLNKSLMLLEKIDRVISAIIRIPVTINCIHHVGSVEIELIICSEIQGVSPKYEIIAIVIIGEIILIKGENRLKNSKILKIEITKVIHMIRFRKKRKESENSIPNVILKRGLRYERLSINDMKELFSNLLNSFVRKSSGFSPISLT